MSHDHESLTDYDITEAMALGGSFASQLATLWRYADESNRLRLKLAFPELWKRYRALAELKREQQEKRA